MKATSTITNKYPDHNTQKTAFPLCALPSDRPRREESNLQKMDNAALQVGTIVKAKLTKDYRLPAEYVIHTVDPVYHGGTRDEAGLFTSCYHCSNLFRISAPASRGIPWTKPQRLLWKPYPRS